MFQIKSYLQYRNTPNGKPRVLVEGVDYNLSYLNTLYLTDEQIYSGSYYLKNKLIIKLTGEMVELANLSDCRPLLSVEIDGEEWTEGDICISDQEFFTKEGGSFLPRKFAEKYGFIVFDGYQMNFELYNKMFHLSNAKNKVGSFFDDPAKYSKLLWDCSEEEGWEKIFKLLEISK